MSQDVPPWTLILGSVGQVGEAPSSPVRWAISDSPVTEGDERSTADLVQPTVMWSGSLQEEDLDTGPWESWLHSCLGLRTGPKR